MFRPFTFLVFFLAGSVTAHASAEGIRERFAVIGSISGQPSSGRPGVALVRDLEAGQRTLAIAVGDSLPGFPDAKLAAVDGRRVIVSDGTQRIELAQDTIVTAPEPMAPVADRAPPSARGDKPINFAPPVPPFGRDELDELDDQDADVDYEVTKVPAKGLYPPPPGRPAKKGASIVRGGPGVRSTPRVRRQ